MKDVTTFDPLDIRVRIDELKQLWAGWLDGKGVPPAPVGLDWLADSFDSYYRDDAKLSWLFPTPEGRVLAESHALNVETDEERARTLDLNKPADWEWLAVQIRSLGGETA